jgi:hypothetical protein
MDAQRRARSASRRAELLGHRPGRQLASDLQEAEPSMPRLSPRSFLSSLLAAQAAVMLVAARAQACPDCPTARVVRASVLDDAFWSTLGLVILPLAVLAGITVALYGIGRSGPTPSLEDPAP